MAKFDTVTKAILWFIAVMYFLNWLGIVRPMDYEVRLKASEASIIDLQYGMKTLGDIKEALAKIDRRLERLEGR